MLVDTLQNEQTVGKISADRVCETYYDEHAYKENVGQEISRLGEPG